MPKGVVKTPADEKKWSKAKSIVKEQHGEMRWPLVMHIFQQMSKAEPNLKVVQGGAKDDENLSREAKIERALNAQGRKTQLPQEVHEHLHAWWSSNKDKVLTPEQQSRLKAIKETKARQSSIRVVKSKEEIDNLQKSLVFLKDVIDEVLIKATSLTGKRGSRSTTWTPNRQYSPQENSAVKKWTDAGYYPIEGAHFSGVEKIGRGHNAAHPLSEPMLAAVKDMAGRKLKDLEHQRGLHANPEHNPHLHAESHLKELHSQKSTAKDFESALKDHIASGKLEGLDDFDRDMAISDFRDQWHKNNLETKKQQSADLASQHSQLVAGAQEARGKNLYQQRKEMLMGGVSLPEDIDFKAYSEQEHDLDEPQDIEEGEDHGYGR